MKWLNAQKPINNELVCMFIGDPLSPIGQSANMAKKETVKPGGTVPDSGIYIDQSVAFG
jgi:hypothetical protein